MISRITKAAAAILILVSWSLPPAYGGSANNGEKRYKTSCSRKSKDKVKNVILMIGDGMGLAQVSALMIENKYAPTSFDRAQSVAICKTYSSNNRITDSGASATAMATGHKTKNGRIGVDKREEPVPNIMELAKEKGLATGIVVTSYLADGTPAGFFAHTPSRRNYEEIARQMSVFQPDVAAGGGLQYFAPYFKDYASTPEEFYATTTTPAIGLFSEKRMQKAPERGDYLLKASEHTLSLLEKTGKGFFVMIEGSQIDNACHKNDIEWILAEMRDFDIAVNSMFDYADKNPGTLVVVVADHETGAMSVISNNKDFTSSESGIQYTFSTTSHSGVPVILYAYGSGASNFNGVIDNTDIFKTIKRLLIDSRK